MEREHSDGLLPLALVLIAFAVLRLCTSSPSLRRHLAQLAAVGSCRKVFKMHHTLFIPFATHSHSSNMKFAIACTVALSLLGSSRATVTDPTDFSLSSSTTSEYQSTFCESQFGKGARTADWEELKLLSKWGILQKLMSDRVDLVSPRDSLIGNHVQNGYAPFIFVTWWTKLDPINSNHRDSTYFFVRDTRPWNYSPYYHMYVM